LIDWFSGSLPCAHFPLEAGRVLKVDSDGQVEWEAPCNLNAIGSHDSNFRVTSFGSDGQGRATHLKLSGNPAKFLQGHNVFGSDDLVSLMRDTYLKITSLFNLKFTDSELEAVSKGDYSVTSIDINYSFDLPNRADVLAWLRAAEYKSKTRHGRPSTKGGTVYWGKNSRRWALKAYSKGEEITAGKGHKLPEGLIDTPLFSWADNKLRLELRLLSKELDKLNLKTASKLTTDEIRKLFNEYARRLEMTEQIALTDKKYHELPSRLRSTYVLWRDGYDLRSDLSKPTYYRHRKEFLEYGIDIAIARESFGCSNIVPLVRVLEAVPAEIPHWAFNQGLVHHSAMRA
jgi:II/X family phage/plasmid replication protein